ncbi:M3 family metallopeptidase [Sphingosinicella microcystinivorans]|uniref:Peptidase M3 n=1 Tax=Sphingosinicella microcystinivorans TaxID=335406 RepID=A0AAD1D2V6_SPHMI|nr:M3 family metallopeptidase [Sphingosinicella microcystinivorans]RKS88662.1 peptidyl-dipeptidase Dcp [Sphingosinicella microcystinivorans]BBE32409.1 peptidase M3 [Sphingosinicella microcystinivorans]
MSIRLAFALAASVSVLAHALPLAAAEQVPASDLSRWTGEWQLPPVDRATPEALAEQIPAAVEAYRRDLAALAADPAPPSFANTIASLDRAGRPLRRLMALLRIYLSSHSDEGWRAVGPGLVAMNEAVLAEALSDPALFSRVSAVYRALPAGISDPEEARLTELTHAAMARAGAGLGAAERARLAEIDGELARLQLLVNQNLNREAAGQFVFFDDAARLDGLPPAQIAAAADLARSQGREGSFAIPNQRPQVFALQTFVRNRETRRIVWQQWMNRGGTAGEFDNRPVAAEILALRKAKAQLLGYPRFADFVLASRMVGTPERALGIIDANWTAVMAADARRVTELAALARKDGIPTIEPWDRIYYLGRFNRERFGIDAQEIAGYFPLPRLRDAIFAAAGDTFGYSFERLSGVPTVSPDIEVYLARREGAPAGIVYLDILPRLQKPQGSWAAQYRPAGDLALGELPVIVLHSSPPPAAAGEEILLPFEYANVLFHEFGHVLHMLASTAHYNGTASLTVPWDFVEVPSLLNERWLLTDRTLDRLPHYRTGAAMPADLRERLRAARQYERVFSVNPEYMAMALVDQKLHQADGPVPDVNAFEAALLAERGFPASADPIMQASAAYHTWSREYAANVYTYLWSDILAADLAEVFLRAPDGLHDREAGERYFDLVLSRANRVPIEQAYREYHGRAPDEAALIRRFGLDRDGGAK